MNEKRQPEVSEESKDDKQREALQHYGLAINMREKSAACYLYGSTANVLASKFDTAVCHTYLDQLLEDARHSADPIEQMVLEQITLAHHNIGRLHVKAANADTIEKTNVYNAAAARLLAEFRRLVLALHEYRTPVSSRHVTVVNQQNLANGDQQVAYLDNNPDESVGKKKVVDNKVVSNARLTNAKKPEIIPESATRGSRKTEPIETKRPDDRGARDAA